MKRSHLVLLASLSACAAIQRSVTGVDDKPIPKAPEPLPAANVVKQGGDGVGPREPHTHGGDGVGPRKTAAQSAPAAPEGVPADKALGWLKNGNLRYVKHNFRRDGRSAEDRSRLMRSQAPHAIVLACSDSRVPPEIVFDQALGEIFVIRVAGEALDSSVVASVEYALEHFGSHLLVVLGHDSCGAIKAAINTPAGQSAGSPDLDKLVADIRPRIKSSMRIPASDDVLPESSMNARGVAADLELRSKIIKQKVEGGQLKVQSAVYHLDSGVVDWL